MEANQATTNQNPMDSEVQPQQVSPNNSRLFTFVVIGILLTAVIAGSIVYFWQKSVNEKAIDSLGQKISSLEEQISTMKKVEIVPQPTSPPVLSPALTIDPTANWLTYSSPNNVYTFKYPRNISLTEGNMIQLSLWGPTQERDTGFYDGIMLNFSLPFHIEDTPISEYIDQEIEQSKQSEDVDILKQKSKINVGGIEGYTYTAQGLGIFEIIYLQSSDKTWTVKIINGTNDPTGQGYDNTVNQILSTFKFTN